MRAFFTRSVTTDDVSAAGKSMPGVRYGLKSLIVAAGLASSALLTEAQQAPITRIPAEPTCRACTIELTKVATLGRATDSVLLGEIVGFVAMNSRGEYFARASSGFQVAVYDSLGRLIRALGRKGAGPGEFRGVTHIHVMAADSLLIADMRNNLQVFTPDFRYVRTIRVPDPGGLALALARDDGTIIAQTRPAELTMFDAIGVIKRTIPVRAPTPGGTCSSCNTRWLAAASQRGRFWSTIKNRYTIELLDTTGAVHQTLSRQPPWFTPWDSMPAGAQSGQRPPVPTIGGIREDRDGLIWVKALVPDANWKPLQPGAYSDVIANGQFDAMLAVIDPKTGALLAERRLPGQIGFVGRDRIFSVAEDDDGIVRAEIWRVELRRRP